MPRSSKKIKRAPPEPDFIKVGIPGFDELFAKGIPKGTNILIAGGPGTGKTIFCLQAIYNAAREGHDCIYITMEESVERLKEHMDEFGWSTKVIENDDAQTKLRVNDAGLIILRKQDPIRVARSVEAMLAKATGDLSIDIDAVPGLIPKGMRPYFVVIDSISAIESAFVGRPESYRIYIEQLFRVLGETKSTSFLITETEDAPTRFSRSGVEEFLADGVIVLYNMKVGDTRVRAIEVLKFRGAKHERKLVPMDVTDRGIAIFPKEKVYGVEGLR
ncbi:MAG: ATPase domain-containing protein [Candidatus Hadarchaeales archaeon]